MARCERSHARIAVDQREQRIGPRGGITRRASRTPRPSHPRCGGSARGPRRRYRGDDARGQVRKPSIHGTATGSRARAREHRPGRTPASASRGSDHRRGTSEPHGDGLVAGRTVDRVQRRPRRSAAVVPPSPRSAGGDLDSRHRGCVQPLLLTRRTLGRILERRRAEEDVSRWQRSSDDDLRNACRVRRELGIG